MGFRVEGLGSRVCGEGVQGSGFEGLRVRPRPCVSNCSSSRLLSGVLGGSWVLITPIITAHFSPLSPLSR